MKQKKRLLIVIWNMGIGGVQKRVRDVVLGIERDYPEWEVYMLVKFKMPNNFMTPLEKASKAKIYYLTESHADSKGIFSVFWIWYHYFKIKPDVCLTFLDHLSVLMVVSNLLFFWRKCKVVLNEGVVTSKYLHLNGRRFYWPILVRWFYPLASLIIVPTKAVKQDLSRSFRVPSNKIQVIPNWTLYPLNYEKKEADIDLLYVGRFEEEKNVLGFIEVVVKVVRRKPKVRSVMLGEGSQKEKVEEKILQSQLTQNVTVKGFSTEVAEYLNRSKILVVPTRNEGMPNVVLEAGACGVPTVTTNFLGVEEVIRDGKTGFIGKSMDELANKVFKLLNNTELLERMGKAAKEEVIKNHHLAMQNIYITTLLSR